MHTNELTGIKLMNSPFIGFHSKLLLESYLLELSFGKYPKIENGLVFLNVKAQYCVCCYNSEGSLLEVNLETYTCRETDSVKSIKTKDFFVLSALRN